MDRWDPELTGQGSSGSNAASSSFKIKTQKINLFFSDSSPKKSACGLGRRQARLRQKDALPATIRVVTMLSGAEPIQYLTKCVSKVGGAKLNHCNCTDKRRDGIVCQDFLPSQRCAKDN
ncbi:hypothetical protein AB7645_04835 [Bradyrhizobium sp. 956_D2_N1_5]|uniref:hypothetical protein n=1 Tax=unclassified Bradyrhizobium TaxID=2631580 RepID=UPI001FD994E7|nr:MULTISPECIES: hypothetical protein [unclassified Bradyrhizobium]